MYQSPSSQRAKLLSRHVPTPSYRHATPAGPWPWVDDVDDQEDQKDVNPNMPAVIGSCLHVGCQVCKKWTAYPQSLFGNWSIKPVRKCGIEKAVKTREAVTSTIYPVDVLDDGSYKATDPHVVNNDNKIQYWEDVLWPDREPGIRVRALFVDNMSGPVLQMFGTRYVIEPFFFSNSINWIPSRYQENVIPKKGDHITITLTFVRSIDEATVNGRNLTSRPRGSAPQAEASEGSSLPSRMYLANQMGESDHIDTRAPLVLRSGKKILHLDLLAVHMVREANSSTVISYHPDSDWCTTSAKELCTRLKLVGRSVYWQLIVRNSKDPTFIFLAILWSALYAWDEALETLYKHFCWLESRVIITNDTELTYELHVIRAHLLHYTSLLEDFRKSVTFVRDVHNPAMDCDTITDATRAEDKALLIKEADNLLSEIHRLEMSRKMLDDRVQNVMHLVFASVNIGDSKAMKRLSYLTMIFLPASFVAGVFGMNVKELNDGTYGTLAHYFEATFPLTLVTMWIVIAFQSQYVLSDPNAGMWMKLLWPIAFIKSLVFGRRGRRVGLRSRSRNGNGSGSGSGNGSADGSKGGEIETKGYLPQ